MKTRLVVSNGGVDLAVYVEGVTDGDVVLLLHGWPDSHHLWDGVVPRLTDAFKVVRMDNRGHGESSDPQGARSISVGALADDIAAVIDTVSPGRPVHILAHDWGSVATWELITRPGAGSRVASFTSVSGPSLGHFGAWARARFRRPSPRNVLQPLAALLSFSYSIVFALPVLPKLLLGRMNEQRWRAQLSRSEGVAADDIHLAPSFHRDMLSGLRIYRSTLLSKATNPLTASGKPTDVPVQILIGTRDPAVRAWCYADESRWADNVWLRVVHGGHWLPFSHPDLLVSAAIELIDAVVGGPAARPLRRARMGVHRKPFEDQLVVVTGAGSGIGRATALAFAEGGADVVVSDIDRAAAEETAKSIRQRDGNAYAYRLDVSDEEAVNWHADYVLAEHGVPDVLINNAGIGHVGRFLDTTAPEFDKVLSVNLHGVLHGCRAFAGAMASRGLGGHIVNLSSMAAYAPQQQLSAYATSKSAVFAFSDSLRAELAASGVQVTTVCPGIVHTNIVATTHFSGVDVDEEARLQKRYDGLYRRRGYGPEKVAARIVRAVRDGEQIVPVTPEAVIQYHLGRLAPGAIRRAATRTSLIR